MAPLKPPPNEVPHNKPPPLVTVQQDHQQIPLILTTLNVRGMHSSYLDLVLTLRRTSPTVISLTETKHNRIQSIWSELLREYKIIHHIPPQNPASGLHPAGTILCVKRAHFKTIEQVPTPKPLQGHIATARALSTTGKNFLFISVYMPQLRDTRTYGEVIRHVLHISDAHPHHHLYVGGDLQATPLPTHKSYSSLLAPLQKAGILSLSDPQLGTFQTSNTPLDHWLHKGPLLASITEATPSLCSDHSTLTVTVPEAGLYTKSSTHPHTHFPTTRQYPAFQFPLTDHAKMQYREGTPLLRSKTQSLIDDITLQSTRPTLTSDIDRLATDLVDVLHDYAQHAQWVWPQKPTCLPGPRPSKLKPPLSRAETRKLARLARLRNMAAACRRKSNSDSQHLPPELVALTEALIPSPDQAPPTSADAIHRGARREIGKILKSANTSLSRKLEAKENKKKMTAIPKDTIKASKSKLA